MATLSADVRTTALLMLANLLCSHSVYLNMHLHIPVKWSAAAVVAAAAGQTCPLTAEVESSSAIHR